MCHNLGANEAADPFKPSAEIHGAMYKWGTGEVALSAAENLDPANNSGGTTWWAGKGGTVPTTSDDWDMTNANPCPPGWKVPSNADWENVLSSNTLYRTNDGGSSWVAGTQSSGWTNSATNYSTGLKIGDALVLPAAGLRYDSGGSLSYRGSDGYYWSSTASGSNGRSMYFHGIGHVLTNGTRSYGCSVRCLSE
jgi:uncharacterized protein (TIGR02145 family)